MKVSFSRWAAIVAALAAPAAAQQGDAAATPASVVALKSAARPFADRITLRGRTEADRRVEVRAEVSGLVASEPIRKGAVVEKGDPLCELAPGERPASLEEARADLKQAKAQFDAAERLSQRGFTAETDMLTKSAELEAARARVRRAEIEMERLVMEAPFSGVLESDTAELGALLQPGSICATLLSLDPIELVGYVPERDVDKLRVGGAAQARLITGRQVEGEIRFVSRSADEETRTYRVEIAAPNPDLAIRDGMTAEIEIGLEPRAAHFAPQSALTLDDEGRLGVRLVEDGVARFRPVDVIGDRPDGVWLAGLHEEAEIIVVGQEFVSDGHPVEPTYAAEASP